MDILIDWIIRIVMVFFIGVAGTLGIWVGLAIIMTIGDFLSDRFK